MKKLYRRFEIPNLEQIQQELLTFYKRPPPDWGTKTLMWLEDQVEVFEACPTLASVVGKWTSEPLRGIKFYVTPPFGAMKAHLDGQFKEAGYEGSVFSVIIPIANYKGTYTTWYTSDPDALINTPQHVVEAQNVCLCSTIPHDTTLIHPFEAVENIGPIVIKADVLHGVQNPLPTHRFVVSIRLEGAHTTNGEEIEIEDVADLTGITIDPA